MSAKNKDMFVESGAAAMRVRFEAIMAEAEGKFVYAVEVANDPGWDNFCYYTPALDSDGVQDGWTKNVHWMNRP